MHSSSCVAFWARGSASTCVLLVHPQEMAVPLLEGVDREVDRRPVPVVPLRDGEQLLPISPTVFQGVGQLAPGSLLRACARLVAEDFYHRVPYLESLSRSGNWRSWFLVGVELDYYCALLC
jgi:hypothetical protein